MKKWYDEEEDVVGLQLSKADYWKSVELPNGVVIDISKEGQIIGIEIHNAKKVFSGDAKRVLQLA
jgi:uncharacterized protein YuzE